MILHNIPRIAKRAIRPLLRGIFILLFTQGVFAQGGIVNSFISFPPAAGGGIARQQLDFACKTTDGTTVTSGTITAVTNGFYVVFIACRSDRTLSTVTDSGTNFTWTIQKSQCGARGQIDYFMAWAKGTPAGNFTVTGTLSSSSTNLSMTVVTYSGVEISGTSFEDVVGANTLGENGACTGGSDNTTPSITFGATTANSMYVVGMNMRSGETSVEDTSPAWTIIGDDQQCDEGSGVATNQQVVEFLNTGTGDLIYDPTLGTTQDHAEIAFILIPD